MSTDKVTDATVEPFDVATAKAHLREDLVSTSNDSLITALITVARTAAEERIHRTLLQTTWLYSEDKFPGGFYPGNGLLAHPIQFSATDRHRNAIVLEYPPILAIDFVKYYDETGTLQTLDPSLYLADIGQSRASLMPAPGAQWPVTQRRINAVQVQYKAGYHASDPSKIPAPIVQWIKLALGDLYNQRRRSSGSPVVPQDFADGLLAPYRLIAI
jgi:hypothetical protein